jgi:hypothetical protein
MDALPYLCKTSISRKIFITDSKATMSWVHPRISSTLASRTSGKTDPFKCRPNEKSDGNHFRIHGILSLCFSFVGVA